MAFIPDYQSSAATRDELGKHRGWKLQWHAGLAMVLSVSATLKAFLVADGILADEKPALIIIFAIASGAVLCSIAVNLSSRRLMALVMDGVSIMLLTTGFVLAVRAWR